jgi:hypothetical protein
MDAAKGVCCYSRKASPVAPFGSLQNKSNIISKLTIPCGLARQLMAVDPSACNPTMIRKKSYYSGFLIKIR